ncbi:MAG: SHOCT domain-containing protein [Actinomycetes bacterium]
MMWDYDSGWGAAGWLLMSLVMISLWLLLVWWFVGLLRRGDTRPATGEWSRETAEEILAKRFAAGDIDEDEYRRRLGVLHESSDVRARR